MNKFNPQKFNSNLYCVNVGYLSRNSILPKLSFIFKNVYITLGNVKLYSTQSKTNISTELDDESINSFIVKNRQKLFKKNFDYTSNNTFLKYNYYNDTSGKINKNKKNLIKTNQFIHYPSAIKEWPNSIYNFKLNTYIKTLPIKDMQIYKLFDSYINYNKLKNYNGITKLFLSKPEIKHYNNKMNITIYVFDKQIISKEKKLLLLRRLIIK